MVEQLKMCIDCKIKPTYTQHWLSLRCKECRRQRDFDTRANRRAYTCNRRAELFGIPGRFTANEWLSVCRYYEFKCLKCKRVCLLHELSPDHVVPLAIGGTNYLSNIQPLCEPCNTSKQSKTADYREIPILAVIPPYEPCDLLKRIPPLV